MLKLDWSLLWTALNVLIWYILIKTFLFKPVNNIIAKRNEKNQAIRKEAEDARAEALALKEQYQKMIDGAEAEGEAIKEKSREEAKVEYEHIVEDAGKKAQVVMDEAHIKIEEEQREDHCLLSAPLLFHRNDGAFSALELLPLIIEAGELFVIRILFLLQVLELWKIGPNCRVRHPFIDVSVLLLKDADPVLHLL